MRYKYATAVLLVSVPPSLLSSVRDPWDGITKVRFLSPEHGGRLTEKSTVAVSFELAGHIQRGVPGQHVEDRKVIFQVDSNLETPVEKCKHLDP